ncbi:hypothetical protein HDU67_001113, partial [Dinochytrium kinnereticum]
MDDRDGAMHNLETIWDDIQWGRLQRLAESSSSMEVRVGIDDEDYDHNLEGMADSPETTFIPSSRKDAEHTSDRVLMDGQRRCLSRSNSGPDLSHGLLHGLPTNRHPSEPTVGQPIHHETNRNDTRGKELVSLESPSTSSVFVNTSLDDMSDPPALQRKRSSVKNRVYGGSVTFSDCQALMMMDGSCTSIDRSIGSASQQFNRRLLLSGMGKARSSVVSNSHSSIAGTGMLHGTLRVRENWK